MDTDSRRASERAAVAGVDAGMSARIVDQGRGEEGQRRGTAAALRFLWAKFETPVCPQEICPNSSARHTRRGQPFTRAFVGISND